MTQLSTFATLQPRLPKLTFGAVGGLSLLRNTSYGLTVDPGEVRGLISAGYVPLASQSSYLIIVYSVTNYRLHLAWSLLGKYVIFAIPT